MKKVYILASTIRFENFFEAVEMSQEDFKTAEGNSKKRKEQCSEISSEHVEKKVKVQSEYDTKIESLEKQLKVLETEIETIRTSIWDLNEQKAAEEFDVENFIEDVREDAKKCWLLDPYLVSYLNDKQRVRLDETLGGWYPVRIKWVVRTIRGIPPRGDKEEAGWQFDECAEWKLFNRKKYEKAGFSINSMWLDDRAKAHCKYLDPYDNDDDGETGWSWDHEYGGSGQAFVKSWAVLFPCRFLHVSSNGGQ